MAAKRIGKTAIDWVAFAERVPGEQKAFFQAFKIKSDSYLRRVQAFPENPPAIDWAFYKSKLATPALVEQFEKQYSALKIPYPAENLTPQIDAQSKQAEQETVQFIKESKERIAKSESEAKFWREMLPFEQMTRDDYRDYFPQYAIDSINRPSMWPHNEQENAEDLERYKNRVVEH